MLNHLLTISIHVEAVISILNSLDLYQYFWVTLRNKIICMYSDALFLSLSSYVSYSLMLSK